MTMIIVSMITVMFVIVSTASRLMSMMTMVVSMIVAMPVIMAMLMRVAVLTIVGLERRRYLDTLKPVLGHQQLDLG